MLRWVGMGPELRLDFKAHTRSRGLHPEEAWPCPKETLEALGMPFACCPKWPWDKSGHVSKFDIYNGNNGRLKGWTVLATCATPFSDLQ